MADLPTFDDLFRIGKLESLARNRKLSAKEFDRKGSDLNILTALSAAMADECVGQLANLWAASFAGTARGAALDRKITDIYPDLIRKQASPSVGYATFTFSSGTAFSIPDGARLTTEDGIQFIVVGDTAVSSADTSKRVPIRSSQAGVGQKAGAGKINSIMDQISGAPGNISVSNAAATFGGEDREEDSDYLVRFRLHYLAARRATKGAITAAVMGVPGVVKCTVIENLDALGRPIGYVKAVVADSYTEQFANTAVLPVTYQAQTASLSSQIENVLEEWRAAGVGVIVEIAKVVLQPVRLSLTYLAGVDEEAIRGRVLALVIQYINNLPPGTVLRLQALRDVVAPVPGLYITGSEVISPIGDVVPEVNEVLRTSSSFVRAE